MIWRVSHWCLGLLLICLDETVRILPVRTGLKEYELAVKLVQLVHLNPLEDLKTNGITKFICCVEQARVSRLTILSQSSVLLSHVTQYPSHAHMPSRPRLMAPAYGLMMIQMERSTSPKQSMHAVDVTAKSSHLGQCTHSALPQDCPAVCGTLNVRTNRAGLCAETCSRFTLLQAAWNSAIIQAHFSASYTGNHGLLPFLTIWVVGQLPKWKWKE